MSTEEQRATWREKAREQRQRKLALASGATPPQVVKLRNGAPEFLTVEKQTTYVIAGGDDTQIALTRDELEQLYQWWKAERKSA